MEAAELLQGEGGEAAEGKVDDLLAEAGGEALEEGARGLRGGVDDARLAGVVEGGEEEDLGGA